MSSVAVSKRGRPRRAWKEIRAGVAAVPLPLSTPSRSALSCHRRRRPPDPRCRAAVVESSSSTPSKSVPSLRIQAVASASSTAVAPDPRRRLGILDCRRSGSTPPRRSPRHPAAPVFIVEVGERGEAAGCGVRHRGGERPEAAASPVKLRMGCVGGESGEG
ncbi:Os05g0399850 [Oryza sativa Japonica Group]|uniref:Uncharacterized protein n=2 Tax=Oryza sativa subsp. japonica TaxID=39947 RepID=A0A8J8XUV5_ORYSJ|nr:hypothetical protein OsJ_18471 [Oryza sativa Japonica Group]BAS93907.1 Os05g0399850 [Oryza sativa Japonica Group]